MQQIWYKLFPAFVENNVWKRSLLNNIVQASEIMGEKHEVFAAAFAGNRLYC